MYKLSELPVSRAIEEEDSTLKVLEDRVAVCRLKKNLRVGEDTMLEKGDIIACTYDGVYGKEPNVYEAIHISDKMWLQGRPSSRILVNDPFLDLRWWRYKKRITLQEFKDCFEILESESELINKHVQMSKEEESKLRKIKFKANNIRSEQRRNRETDLIIKGCILGVAFLVSSIMFIIRAYIAFDIGLACVSIAAFILITIAEYSEAVPYIPLFKRSKFKKNKKELKELKEQFETELSNATASLDNIRCKDGWLVCKE